ncbi:hypothetical protein ABZP36_036021 [Zizania latifolia]
MAKPRLLALLLLLALALSQGTRALTRLQLTSVDRWISSRRPLISPRIDAGVVVVVVEGRNVQLVKPVRRYGRWSSPLHGSLQQEEAGAGMVSTVLDYSEPKPNTNPRGGVLPPPDPTSPPAH